PDLVLRHGTAAAEQSSERLGDSAVELTRLGMQLLDDLDDRPVGDPLAVRQTAAADDVRVDPREKSGREPRLADARDAEQREQLADAVGDGEVERLLEEQLLAATPDER